MKFVVLFIGLTTFIFGTYSTYLYQRLYMSSIIHSLGTVSLKKLNKALLEAKNDIDAEKIKQCKKYHTYYIISFWTLITAIVILLLIPKITN